MHGIRIIAGQWRGKALATPAGSATRPTNIRARQSVFDMLFHASWAGPSFMQSARVLDVFSGTGAFGLESLSRGAAYATFIENDLAALKCLRANIATCRAERKSQVIAADAANPPQGMPHDLIFLDPPYGRKLLSQTLDALEANKFFSLEALFVAELGPNDDFVSPAPLAIRQQGKARIVIWPNCPKRVPV